MQEPRKSTLLFVQDAAAEPAALGAFAAEQPALALVTADGLDEAERKLAQLDPALVVWQCDAPGLPARGSASGLPKAVRRSFYCWSARARMRRSGSSCRRPGSA